MTRISFLFFIGLAISLNAQGTLTGFTPETSQKQLQLEAAFEAQLNPENLDLWMQKMAAEPHWVGTEYGRKNAEWLKKQFTAWGYDTKIETYHILFPYPKRRSVRMTEPTPYTAKLTAVPVAGDPYTGQGDALLPSYNAFSTDGDVTADLVFVNYGIPEDYETLEKLGIDVKGKIVIAKYQGSWRGIKPKLAAEKGAIGCLIYSDPKDDGYVRGDVYPKGPFKNKTGVQRGSVMDMPTYPGDVLTPGYAATKNAERLDRKEAPTITKIPVLPISYEDALPLLTALEGPVVPKSWSGGLPITYHVGPGPAKVNLTLEFNWSIIPAHNVIATLKGSQFPDQWVMRGNHHDAWVHGANDPVSGMVALMEEARALGELAKNGNTPKRTVVYCAWDAEEPGLIGSTEWVEDHKQMLQQKVVAYINSDSNGRGFLNAGGSHSLQQMVGEVANVVKDPQTGVSVGQRKKALNLVKGRKPGFRLYALGSGSDYTPFIQHAGIASINLGYGGENAGGEYHTIYDTYPHYVRFKDPEFAYGVALANTAGRITMRMANADILPFAFAPWYETVNGYLENIVKSCTTLKKEVEQYNFLVSEHAFELAADPKKTFVRPKKKEVVPDLDFGPIQKELEALKKSIATLTAIDITILDKKQKRKLNGQLLLAEQALTSDQGLPRRPWYKHQIYAPGFYTGYGVKTLPGVREAIEEEHWDEARAQISVLAKTLQKFNAHIEKCTRVFK